MTRDRDTDPRELDTYSITCVGTAECSRLLVYYRSDGTETHVVTIRGVRPSG